MKKVYEIYYKAEHYAVVEFHQEVDAEEARALFEADAYKTIKEEETLEVTEVDEIF